MMCLLHLLLATCCKAGNTLRKEAVEKSLGAVVQTTLRIPAWGARARRPRPAAELLDLLLQQQPLIPVRVWPNKKLSLGKAKGQLNMPAQHNTAVLQPPLSPFKFRSDVLSWVWQDRDRSPRGRSVGCDERLGKTALIRYKLVGNQKQLDTNVSKKLDTNKLEIRKK